MAATLLKSEKNPYSPLSISNTLPTKSQKTFVLSIITFCIFIFLAIAADSRHLDTTNYNMPPTSNNKNLLLSRREQTLVSISFSDKAHHGTRTTGFRPRNMTMRNHGHSKTKGREFEANAHEVPSGPNPICN